MDGVGALAGFGGGDGVVYEEEMVEGVDVCGELWEL